MSLADQAALAPPENFAMVWKGIYRSGYPSKRNLTFLRTLGLRSILFLCPEDYPDSHLGFLEECGIQLLQFGVVGNKEPFDEIPEDVLRAALDAVLDQTNQPILIHCNQGKHRTGCLVGCLRKVQRWSLVAIFEEYRRFAGSKARVVDQHFIERFTFDDGSSAGADEGAGGEEDDGADAVAESGTAARGGGGKHAAAEAAEDEAVAVL